LYAASKVRSRIDKWIQSVFVLRKITGGKILKKLFVRFFVWFGKSLEEKSVKIEQQEEILNLAQPETIINFPPYADSVKEAENTNKKITDKKKKKNPPRDIIEFDPRDMMEVMEVPFLALSKNRTEPIIYESKDGKTKVQVSAHRKHYVASIYDWDIILLVSAKIQEIINSSKDIPPRTLIIPRNEILRALHKHNGKKQEKDLKSSLARLKLTGIETTIRNEHGKYEGGFGFLDSWGYTEREDVKEIKITLSQWLYDGICRKGSLLKVSQGYFDLTSGLKKFLYRTARKHVGHNNNYWEFSVEKLYEKSASEQEFKKFKYDLKKAVSDNDIPDYFLEWREEKEKTLIRFINKSKDPQKITKKTVKNQVNKVVSTLKIPSHFKK
jgi:plasmid replication initiation protein